jgi:hypothetical protein
MDELQISGRRYISSRRVARENGYHTDYIGQLIRGGKVKGQKVGRAWYVDAESFAIYLGKEIPATPIEDAAVEVTPEIEVAPAPTTVTETEPEEVVDTVAESTKEESPEEITSADDTEDDDVKDIAEEKETEEVQEEIEMEDDVEETTEVPVRTTNRIAINAKETMPKTMGGLRYYPESEPLMPEVRSSEGVSRVADERIEGQVEVSDVRTRPAKAAASHRGMHAPALVVIGIAALVFGVVVSSALVVHMSIDKDNVASVQYGVSF